MDPAPFFDLVKTGGPVLIALVVLAGLVFFGFKFIWLPAQKQTKAIAEVNKDAAKEHTKAATAHAAAAESNARAAQFNATTSEANSRTAAHLERLTMMLMDAALSSKKN